MQAVLSMLPTSVSDVWGLCHLFGKSKGVDRYIDFCTCMHKPMFPNDCASELRLMKM